MAQLSIKEKIEIAKQTITKEMLIEAYTNNKYDKVPALLNISFKVADGLCKEYGISKKELGELRKKATWAKKETSRESIDKRITEEELTDLYITKDLSAKECEKILNVGGNIFYELLAKYNIRKDKDKHAEKIKQTKLEKYGDANYNNRDKASQTCIEKYGVENPSQFPETTAKIRTIRISNDSYRTAAIKNLATREANSGSIKQSYRDMQPKIRATCMAKYGVECSLCIPGKEPAYNSVHSRPNEAFASRLESNKIAYEREFPIIRYRYDFKVGNNLIEINPYATHNVIWSPFNREKGIDKDYHFNKTKLASDNGYRCIHVFDWEDSNKIISLLKDRPTVYARKCDIREVKCSEAKSFLNNYHLQGYAKDKIRFGLYYNDELISLMTFAKPRYNKKFDYELIRYCSIYNIIGGENKLFNHFIKTYNPTSIISYCDNSKFTGVTYNKLGFILGSYGTPTCHWYNPSVDVHITDNFLRQRGFDQLFGTNYGKGTSNEELMLEYGFLKIYDCGQSRYEWYVEEH